LLVGIASTAPAIARSGLESNAREALLDMQVRIARAELAAAKARAQAAKIRAQIDALREARRLEADRRAAAETSKTTEAEVVVTPVPVDSIKQVKKPKVRRPQPPPAPPSISGPAEVDGSTLDRPIPLGEADALLMVRAIMDATNIARREHGLPALEHNAILDRAATGHARRMVESGFFSHHDPEVESLKTPSDRLGVAGAANPKAAENIITEVAIEYESGENVYVRDRKKGHFSRTADGPILPRHTYRSFAQSVVDRWMDSPGHRKNILAKDALQIGIGTAFRDERGFPTFVAVQNFQWYEPIRAKNDGV
jgi:uncharacterized protein YkwD